MYFLDFPGPVPNRGLFLYRPSQPCQARPSTSGSALRRTAVGAQPAKADTATAFQHEQDGAQSEQSDQDQNQREDHGWNSGLAGAVALPSRLKSRHSQHGSVQGKPGVVPSLLRQRTAMRVLQHERAKVTVTAMADPSVALWIYRAAEALGLADTMTDPEAKRLMLGVVAGYERLAEHAAARKRREDTNTLPPPPAVPGAA
jgi:hypothetical protein